MKITSYYIDDADTMHTYIGELKHVTISNVMSEEEAEKLIDELNEQTTSDGARAVGRI